jgi:transcriptional regulator with XRE-family HTH domain
MTISAAQLKAARQLLGWSQDDVASTAGVSTEAVVYLEHGTRAPKPRALADIRLTLEAAGIEFANGGAPGAKLRKANDAKSLLLSTACRRRGTARTSTEGVETLSDARVKRRNENDLRGHALLSRRHQGKV